MNAVVLALLVTIGILTSAVAGPWLLRHSAPALVHIPRLAALILTTSVVLWLLAFLALGPMTAWIISGPAVLPGQAAEICQRCLVSANPLGGTFVQTGVPAVLLLALPALAALTVVARAMQHLRRRRRILRGLFNEISAISTRGTMAGYPVLLTNGLEPTAFALPRKWGGIVISTGALALLTPEERVAVLAHERAHLRQHHHVIIGCIESLAHSLRWVPLVAAAADALPHYLEIAADDAARRRTGTTAVAGALLKLGNPLTSDAQKNLPSNAGFLLHAAGPQRIRHLVAPVSARGGAGPAIATVVQLAVLASISGGVVLPYVTAAVNGCT